MRKIKVYAICENIDNALDNIYTIVATKKQVNEYIMNRSYLEYLPHYLTWCELHNENSELKETFIKYLDIVHRDDCIEFKVIKLKYTVNTLCSLLRTLSECVPVGTSYELEEEFTNFLTKKKKDN